MRVTAFILPLLLTQGVACEPSSSDPCERALSDFRKTGLLRDWEQVCAKAGDCTSDHGRVVVAISTVLYPENVQQKSDAHAILLNNPEATKDVLLTLASLRAENQVVLQYIDLIADFLSLWSDQGWRVAVLERLIAGQAQVVVELEKEYREQQILVTTEAEVAWVERLTIVLRELLHLVESLGVRDKLAPNARHACELAQRVRGELSSIRRADG